MQHDHSVNCRIRSRYRCQSNRLACKGGCDRKERVATAPQPADFATEQAPLCREEREFLGSSVVRLKKQEETKNGCVRAAPAFKWGMSRCSSKFLIRPAICSS